MPALDMITEQNKRSLSWTQMWCGFKQKVQQTYNAARTADGYVKLKEKVASLLLDDTQTTKRVDKIITVLGGVLTAMAAFSAGLPIATTIAGGVAGVLLVSALRNKYNENHTLFTDFILKQSKYTQQYHVDTIRNEKIKSRTVSTIMDLDKAITRISGLIFATFEEDISPSNKLRKEYLRTLEKCKNDGYKDPEVAAFVVLNQDSDRWQSFTQELAKYSDSIGTKASELSRLVSINTEITSSTADAISVLIKNIETNKQLLTKIPVFNRSGNETLFDVCYNHVQFLKGLTLNPVSNSQKQQSTVTKPKT